MKKIRYTFKAIAFMLYKYYSTGPRATIAFFAAKGIIALIVWLHVVAFSLIFFHNAYMKLNTYVLSLSPIGSRVMLLIELAAVFGVVTLLLGDEDGIKYSKYDSKTLKKIRIWSFLYLFAFIVFAGLIVYEGWYIN